MKAKQIFKISVAVAAVGLLSLSSCEYRKSRKEKLNRKTIDEYEHVDLPDSYDFYSREKMDVSIFLPWEAGYPYDDKCEGWSSFLKIKEQMEKDTNTNINFTFFSSSTYANNISAALSTGNTPDLYFRVPDLTFIKNQKAAYKLYDLLMQYAPDYRKNLTLDDWIALTDVDSYEIYSIMNIREPEYMRSYMIREDWLRTIANKLSFKITDYSKLSFTWDQFKEILSNFNENPKIGNGSAIPFCADLKALRYLFGINTAYYFVADSEAATYESVPEDINYSRYIKEMQRLYASKLLSNDYIIHTQSDTDLLAIMSNDKLGATYTYCEYAQMATDTLGREGAKWTGFKLTGPEDLGDLENPDGYDYIPSAAGMTHSFCISSKVSEEKAVELMRFLNYFYRPAGELLTNYGVEGYHFDYVEKETEEGEKYLYPKIRPEYSTFVNARKAGLIYASFPFHWLEDSYQYMVKTGKEYEDLTPSQKSFYDTLGIGKYNFKEQSISLDTNEWLSGKDQLDSRINQFETEAIKGTYTGKKLTAQLNSLVDSFKKCADAGRDSFSTIVDLNKKTYENQ